MVVANVGKGTIFIVLFFIISDISLKFPSIPICFPYKVLASSSPFVWHKYLKSNRQNFSCNLLKKKDAGFIATGVAGGAVVPPIFLKIKKKAAFYTLQETLALPILY